MRHLRNPVVIFGIMIVLLCWVGACLQVFAERGEASRVAIERGDTAARLFEKDTVSLLKGIDAIMLLLRQAYEDDPKRLDLIGLARRAGLGSEVPTEISLVTSDGYLTQRTTGDLPAPQRFSTLDLGRVRRRIAINVARLPELLRRAERD